MSSKELYELRIVEVDNRLKRIEDKLEEKYGVPEKLLNEWGTLAIRMTLLEVLLSDDDAETMLKALDVYEVMHALNTMEEE